MNTPDDDKDFAQNARASFDDSVDKLDAATLSKLNQGRQAALAQVVATGSARQWQRWMPATGVAAAALLAVVVLRGPATVDIPDGADPTVTDFEILMGDDALEMIEDLEFYSWIDMADLDATDNVG